MMDFFLQIGLSNACLSLALAIVAMVVGATTKRPHLAYMLWLLVFVKLVTPPVVTIPVVTIPAQPETALVINDHSRPEPPVADGYEIGVHEQPASAETASAPSLPFNIATVANRAKPWLASIWFLGSVGVLAWSMVRVCRFSRLLAVESDLAPQELQTAATKIARRLGLKTVPMICTTSARLSPMVWWTGGRVRMVIPTALLDQMDARQWQWILAHELAHVRRRDYLVRWLEWSACVCFWWNPVVWWAQRNLRAAEEICCDDLVMSCLNPKPKLYANSLLAAVEFLARPVLRPPAMASEINSGGALERRFEMIMSNKPNQPNSRWLLMCVLLCAMVVLPLGIASAQDLDTATARIRAAVASGQMTPEEGRAKLAAYRERLTQAAKAETSNEEKVAAAAARIRANVAAGKMTPEEGRARLAAYRERLAQAAKAGTTNQKEFAVVTARIRAAIQAGKITPEEGRARLAAYKERLAQTARTEASNQEKLAAAVARIRAAVQAGEMTREEASETIAAYRRRLAGQGDRAGSGDNIRNRIIQALTDNGIARENVESVLGTLRLIVGEIQREGDAFELDPGVRESLAGMGLTGEQINFVTMLAQRLASRPAN